MALMFNWSKVDELLGAATVEPGTVEPGTKAGSDIVAPGMELLVSKAGEVLYQKAFGSKDFVAPLKLGMTFDVASLTKALVTSVLAMKLVDRGQLDLDKKLSHIFQTFGTLGKEKIRVRNLLNHSSGFEAHVPYYKELAKLDLGAKAGILTSRGALEHVKNIMFRSEISYPTGSKSEYSDLGFILLGKLIEVVTGADGLDKLANKEIFAPLKLAGSGFVNLSSLRHHNIEAVQEVIVPTLECPWRAKTICGEVHDDNAWAMGGVCGHAGLFTNASDIHVICKALVDSYKGRSEFISTDTIKTFWKMDESVPASTWALGWDTPSKSGSSSGKYFSKDSVGHLGYTGCSVWIDVPREVVVLLLSNRTFPDNKNKSIKEFRPVLHDQVMSVLGYA